MKNWSITWGERTWTSDDAKGAHLSIVSELTGDAWDAVSPWSGPRSLQAWIVAFLATENGGDLASALAVVYGAPVGDFVDALSELSQSTA